MISYNKMYDPEYLCGKYSFKLKVDLKNNTYILNDFNLSYNVDECIPENGNQSQDNNNPTQSQGKLSQLKDNAYNLVSNNPTAVAGVATTGLLSGTALALFLTGILGGKRKRKQIKRNSSKKRKTQKRRRHNSIKKKKNNSR
jgi:adenine/guanine phosphoribosyltransferase-like PRPP-binding protein